MTTSAKHGHASSPRAFILLPVAVALHIAEEWFGGFIEWARLGLGVEIESGRFISVNLVGLVLFALGAAAAYREPRAAWIGVALTVLVFVNGIVHAVLSVVVGAYSPGTITALVLYVPLSIVIFRWAKTALSPGALAGAAVLGVAIHAVATMSAVL